MEGEGGGTEKLSITGVAVWTTLTTCFTMTATHSVALTNFGRDILNPFLNSAGISLIYTPGNGSPPVRNCQRESKNCVIFISQKLLKTYLWIWRSVIRLYIGKSNQMSQAVDRSCIGIHDVKKEVCLRESLRPYDLFFFSLFLLLSFFVGWLLITWLILKPKVCIEMLVNH